MANCTPVERPPASEAFVIVKHNLRYDVKIQGFRNCQPNSDIPSLQEIENFVQRGYKFRNFEFLVVVSKIFIQLPNEGK